MSLLRLRALAVALTALVLQACRRDEAAPPDRPDRPGDRIAFESDRDGPVSLYLVNADGTGLVRLAGGPGGDRAPAWSPDGTRLVFESTRDGPSDLWIVRADASGLRRMTDPGYSHHSPAWSPDGAAVAFERHAGFDSEGEDNPVPNIFVIRVDGPGLRRLSRTEQPGEEDSEPAWSRDGTRLAFVRRERTGGAGRYEFSTHVLMINADGSGLRRLTNARADDRGPVWSPDGTRLAFERRERHGGDGDIWVMGADGSGLRRLTRTPEDDTGPVWSPDGGRIAFVRRERAGSADIWMMGADGSSPTSLTDHPALDEAPAFSPDGGRLAFHSDRDGNLEIYVINADGSGLARLTDHPARDANPRWSPARRATAPAAAGVAPTSFGPADVPRSFGPRFNRLDSLFVPLAASVESLRARMRPDSGTERADSALVAFQRSSAARIPYWGDEFEAWINESTVEAFDTAARYFTARGLVLRASEGTFWLTQDPAFMLRRVGSLLTPPMRAYLEIMADEALGYESDGRLLISWDELADRIVQWERFLETHPAFARWDSLWTEARGWYSRYLSAYVRGLENTWLFGRSDDTPPDILLADVRASYERLVAEHGGTRAARYVRGLLDVMRRSGYRDGPEREAYLRTTPQPAPGRPGS